MTMQRLPTLLSRLLRHVLMPLIWAGVLGAVVMSLVARHFTSEAYDRASAFIDRMLHLDY